MYNGKVAFQEWGRLINKILIIEDDLEINALLADFLKEKGYAVHCQYDGLHVLDFLNKEKIDLIINPMEIEINSKKLIGRLYDKMREEVNETDLLIDNNMLFQNIEGFFLHIADNFDFDLTYKEKIELADILKMLDVKIVEKYNDQIEKIVEYMRSFSLLFGINYFIFINLNTFFDNYEIEKIYEFAEYNKINIFLVENRQPDFIANYTQIKIIDKDNCEISFNM